MISDTSLPCNPEVEVPRPRLDLVHDSFEIETDHDNKQLRILTKFHNSGNTIINSPFTIATGVFYESDNDEYQYHELISEYNLPVPPNILTDSLEKLTVPLFYWDVPPHVKYTIYGLLNVDQTIPETNYSNNYFERPHFVYEPSFLKKSKSITRKFTKKKFSFKKN